VALDQTVMNARRFPPPWSVEEQQACFVVRDRPAACPRLLGRRSAAKLFTKDEARRIAANIAKLPELLSHRRTGRDSALARQIKSVPSVVARRVSSS